MIDRAPPHLFFVVSAVFHYLGPSFAVLLFVRVDVLGVAWLRIVAAAAVFGAWRRPWRAFGTLDRSGQRLLVAWAAVLAVMNCCFYVAIDRLPLGTVAAIEFLPVIALAALGARVPRNVVALGLACVGVWLLADVHLGGEPLGLALAFVNAAFFALYIVLAHRVARLDALAPIDGLAISMLIAAVIVTPLAGWAALPALTDPVALAAGVGVGISSSVIPYVCDQLAMRRLARATYALMVALLPATATVIGIVVLTQIPTTPEVGGVVLVIAAVALHREAADGYDPAVHTGEQDFAGFVVLVYAAPQDDHTPPVDAWRLHDLDAGQLAGLLALDDEEDLWDVHDLDAASAERLRPYSRHDFELDRYAYEVTAEIDERLIGGITIRD